MDVEVEVREKFLNTLLVVQKKLHSDFLQRDVIVDFYLPTKVLNSNASLLLINDGQDLVTINFAEILDDLVYASQVQPLICVGIHCGHDRNMEYGTAFTPDYAGRGAKAGLYTKFIFSELMPYVRDYTRIMVFKEMSFAGFSLGALSAFDIAWNHPNEFSKVGIFSGSLWWRRKSYEAGYSDDKDRIMHNQVSKGEFYPWMKFFFECGLLDETADRNNNGVIDTVDDVLDMMAILRRKGYKDSNLHYLELEDGRHDVTTWARSLPIFLQWGWGDHNK